MINSSTSCAVIAAITKSPTGYNPITNPEANQKRRLNVLDEMLELEYITKAEYDEALKDDPYTRIAEAGSILFSVRAPVGRLNITKNKRERTEKSMIISHMLVITLKMI